MCWWGFRPRAVPAAGDEHAQQCSPVYQPDGIFLHVTGSREALIAAKRRGVDVRVVLDSKGNQGRASVAAINLLVNAEIEVRTVDNYRIMHDKVAIIDGVTTQTGSFNYSRAAQRSNSENVVVMWQMPEVAQVYLEHWQSRWAQGQVWQSRY